MTTSLTPPPVHVVGGLLVAEGRVLLGHRSPHRRWYPDVWDVPGGHVEAGESGRAALDREVREELGVTVGSAREHERIRVPGRAATDPAVELDLWLVTSWTGTPVNRSPEEHDQLAWFGLDELPTATLAHPALEGLLRGILTDGTPP
ncbi:NUDIX domain-containing protein [Cellulomonas xylanilytica]|uniref:8-oxo-dGTP diphosphatase n=1 Tax=Cellulomonas xylanilytica TaxID=233583 RepID=A0A510V4F1_9CELL|nr:NUDIX domain-containing protein [Cellulomonas xylanilytica]GEK21757.1 putative MutT/nudix family protein [Cellulomonas xylanilytica]